MRRVLVLGGSGWLGSSAVPLLAARFDVSAPSHRELDVADADALRRAFAASRPEVVVNLAAVNPGGGDAAAMRAVNADGAAHVAHAAHVAGAHLVHMSTDLVLDGRAPPYSDDAPACPVNEYGRTKAAGEERVRAEHPGALLLRTSLVFDPAAPDRFTRSVLERLARGERARLFVDEVRCPIARTTLAAVLVETVERAGDPPLRGTMNVAGTQPLTRMELGLRLLRRFGATRLDLVEPARAADAPEPRPLDLRLDVSRARSVLCTPLRSLDAELSGT